MRVPQEFLSTDNLPSTFKILNRDLPSIFTSKCFNEKNLPFTKEVLNTELGHLFEHILLEYLTILTRTHFKKNVSYSGKTSWNWVREELGLFHIKIDSGAKESSIFNEALALSSHLLEKIINNSLKTN